MIYQYQERNYRRKKRQSSYIKKFLVLIIFCLVVWGILTTSFSLLRSLIHSSSAKKIKSPIGKILPAHTSKGLMDAVGGALEGTTGTYSVAIKNLRTNESYFKNEHREYQAASLYKLWVMLTVMDEIDRGILSEDTTLKANATDLNEKFDIASEEAEMTEGEIKMSVSEALNRMITISHNYAALLLTAQVKVPAIRAEMDRYGFSVSKLDPPRTTAREIMEYYEKLYKGELISKERSGQMLDLLKGQELNDRIPLYLPENIESAHKTGEIGPFKHDAGIVFTDKGDYIIVLMSKSDDPQAASMREALISQEVFKYFQK